MHAHPHKPTSISSHFHWRAQPPLPTMRTARPDCVVLFVASFNMPCIAWIHMLSGSLWLSLVCQNVRPPHEATGKKPNPPPSSPRTKKKIHTSLLHIIHTGSAVIKDRPIVPPQVDWLHFTHRIEAILDFFQLKQTSRIVDDAADFSSTILWTPQRRNARF